MLRFAFFLNKIKYHQPFDEEDLLLDLGDLDRLFPIAF